MSLSSTINCENQENNTQIIRNRPNVNVNLNKNNSVNESISYYLYKIDESLVNNVSRNKINQNGNKYKVIKKKKNRVPVNITNNNYNVQKNNVLINLDSVTLEKLKIQQKLEEYNRIIDKKINNLKQSNIKKEKSIKRKYSLNKEKDSENSESYRNSKIKKKLSQSYFINPSELQKININYINSKRDSSNVFHKKKN